jgi:hypothetical protein
MKTNGMRKGTVLFILCACLLAACKPNQSLKDKQAEVENGKIDENFKYICNDVGWETYLPKDWNVITKDESKKLTQKGKEALQKSLGTSVDMSALKELVNIKKDAFNSFLSTIENFDVNNDGDYNAHNVYVDKVICDAYTNNKINFKKKAGSEEIDHINFHTLEIRIFAPNSDKILLTQKIYSALLKGYDFGMTLNYNNEEDKQTLLNIINTSKFF